MRWIQMNRDREGAVPTEDRCLAGPLPNGRGSSCRPTWERRIARARELAGRYPAAAEILAFYARLMEAQRDASNFDQFVDAVGAFAPEKLRDNQEFLKHAFDQSRTEAAFPRPNPQKWGITSLCPCCNAQPQVAVLREEQHGARRNLVCSDCAWEWEFQRILCSACGGDRFDSLPGYRAEQVPTMRVEGCDTCQ